MKRYEARVVSERFQSEGFAVVGGLLSAAEVEKVGHDLERYVQDVVPRVDPAHAFYKPAHVGSAAFYHQDNAYLHLDPADGAVVWIALNATSVAKGAFRLGDLSHEETNHLLFSKALAEPPDPNRFPEVPALLDRGDATIHHILTPHRSGPNTTDRNRRGLVLNFKAQDARTNESQQAAHAAYLKRLYGASDIGTAGSATRGMLT